MNNFNISELLTADITTAETTIVEAGISNQGSILLYLKNDSGGAALTEFKVYAKTRDGEYQSLTPSYPTYTTLQTLAAGSSSFIFVNTYGFNTMKFTAKTGTTTTLTYQWVSSSMEGDEANWTAALALLLRIAVAVEIMDDWDESDRCKVNPIVGQAGVQGNTGNITALTQRVTVANDDAMKVCIGTSADAAVEGDVAGTIDAQLRGINKNAGATSDGSVDGDAAGSLSAKIRGIAKHLGVQADSAITGDSAGTISAKLRGIIKMLGDLGAAADVDGTQAGQLRYIGEAVAATQTAVEIMDDWDESDRCKVNIADGSGNLLTSTGGDLDVNVTASALPSGAATEATLADIKTAVQIMDDWDDGADHCEVVGIETEGASPSNKLFPVSGKNVAGTAASEIIVDEPANITVSNKVLSTHDYVTGLCNSAATEGDADGTLSSKLRGIAKNIGVTSDAASSSGTLSAKLRYIAEAVYTDADTFADGMGISGLEATSDPGAGTAGKAYGLRTYHKMLAMAGFDFTTGSMQNTPLSKALPNSDALTTLQNASTTSADGTTYTNSGNYTDVVFYAKTAATAGGTADTTDIHIESSPDGSVWHPEHIITGTAFAGATTTAYAPVVFSRPKRKYWRARTVKNGAGDTLTTTVYIDASAE